jgi:hypothetical protein
VTSPAFGRPEISQRLNQKRLIAEMSIECTSRF